MSTRHHFFAAALLGAALLTTGCKHSATPDQAQQTQPQGVRNSDGSITNPDGSITYPAGTLPPSAQPTPQTATAQPTTPPPPPPAATAPIQTAKATPPPAAKPAPPPPPPPPVVKVVPNGAAIPVTITETLSASRNNVGDGFTGVLRQSVTTASGDVVFPRGTSVKGAVVAAKGKGRFKGAGALGIQITSIGGTDVSTTEYEAANKGRGKRTAGFIGGGGGLGALIGGLAGGGKGALIGGLAGAGAGTAGAAYTGNRDVVIPSETALTFRLTQSVSVQQSR